MPLPNDEKLLALANDLLAQFETLFGQHSGFRPAHAKGILLKGTFTPDPSARELTRAPHVMRESTPVTVRFSNSTGLPMLPDNELIGNPRGLAVRFYLAARVHTDIVSHSTDGFPSRNGQEFLEFLRAVVGGEAQIGQFLAAHPWTLRFVEARKPNASSFAREAYFGVTAMKFSNASGEARFGRYQITPHAGVEHLDDTKTKTMGANYLYEEIAERVAAGPIGFDVKVQIANPGDIVDDATISWPSDREVRPFGTLSLTSLVENDAAEQKHIIFDPIPRVDGIEPSDDPLLELRAAIYLLSGRRRRAASTAASA